MDNAILDFLKPINELVKGMLPDHEKASLKKALAQISSRNGYTSVIGGRDPYG